MMSISNDDLQPMLGAIPALWGTVFAYTLVTSASLTIYWFETQQNVYAPLLSSLFLSCISKGELLHLGMFGRVEAWTAAVKEQGRKTFHAHFLIWLDGWSDLHERLCLL